VIIKTQTLFIFFLGISFTLYSQQKRIEINGVILNPFSNGLKNSHIINLSSKEGAISDTNGAFTIKAKKGDWLQITNIQYRNKKIKITQNIDKDRFVRVYLILITNLLKEVQIKKRMTGFLGFDRIEKPKDTLPKIDKEYYNFSKMDFTAYDTAIKQVKKIKEKGEATYLTDPTMKNVATTISSVAIPDKSSIKKRAMRKELNFKESFPEKLKKLFGDHFFFVRLKIPKDKYYHFLAYCNSLGIEELYKNNKHLDILKILLKESKSYILLLENNK